MKSFSSDKRNIIKTITLNEGKKFISDNVEVAEITNNLFSKWGA